METCVHAEKIKETIYVKENKKARAMIYVEGNKNQHVERNYVSSYNFFYYNCEFNKSFPYKKKFASQMCLKHI